MARPTTTGLDRNSYAPQQQGATQRAGVYAPLDVRVGPSGAEQLAKSLGLAAETVTPMIRNEVMRKAGEQTREGMRDAATGNIDPKRAAEDEYYARGQKKTLADRAVINAINEWEKRYATGDVDKSSVEKVQQDYDSFMGERLASFLADPEAAQWALEKIAPHQAQALGQLQKDQVEAFKADTIATVGDSIRLAVKTKTVIDFEAEKAKLGGAGFSKGEATKQLVDSLGSIAVEARDPAILDMIPERWPDGTPGPRSVPELNNEINQYRYYAESQQRAEGAEIKRQAEKLATGQVNEATIMAANGNLAGAKKLLDDLLRKGLIERSEYQSVVNFGRGTVDFYREESFTADKVAAWRSDLAEGKFGSEREANAAARAFLPGGSVGGRAMQQMADDTSAYFRSRENDSNPLVRSHRNALDARLTATVETPQTRVHKADMLLEYDRQIAAGKKPDEAFESVSKLVENTAPPTAVNSTAPRKVGNATVIPLN